MRFSCKVFGPEIVGVQKWLFLTLDPAEIRFIDISGTKLIFVSWHLWSCRLLTWWVWGHLPTSSQSSSAHTPSSACCPWCCGCLLSWHNTVGTFGTWDGKWYMVHELEIPPQHALNKYIWSFFLKFWILTCSFMKISPGGQ